MTDELDPRIVRVSLEVDGKFQVYEGLDIRARGQKSANPLQNTCEVDISNLTAATRNQLLTETSPYNPDRKPRRMIVEAGRKSYGTTRLFYGEITSSSPSQPPDIGLNLKSQTGQHAKSKAVARSGTALQSHKALAQQIAGDLGVSLDYQAEDRQIANYSFTGSALRQVDALASAGGVDAFVDDETLIIKPRGTYRRGLVRVVDLDSGMVGIPEVTEKGIKVRMMLDNTTVIGGALSIKSKLNPAANGLYVIYGLDFEIASRDTPFYFVASCSRDGKEPKAPGEKK